MLVAVAMWAGPVSGDPAAPAGVDLPALLRAGNPVDLQTPLDGLRGDSPSTRWARARLHERQAEVLSAAGLAGASGEAAARGLGDCGTDAWEVAARLHLIVARRCDELGPDRRAAYDGLRERTWEAEVAAADAVVGRLGDTFGARVIGRQMEAERSYHSCRTLPDANPDRLLGPVVQKLRDLRTTAGDTDQRSLASGALCSALNDYADACRRQGNELSDAGGGPARAVALLKAAVRLSGEAWEAYGDVPNPVSASQATLLQNRALALLNLGEVLLYATSFDDPRLTAAQKEALLQPVRQSAPPTEATRLLQEASRLVGAGRTPAQAPPAMRLHWMLLQNLARALTYEVLVTSPADPTPGLLRAQRLARRSGDALEGLGLYREALDAMAQEARALELGGQMIEAVLVYLHGIGLCERTVAGLAPAEGAEYRRTRDAMFGRLNAVLLWLRQQGKPFPEELLGEWGASWEEMAWQVSDLAKARTFADLVQMGAVWRESQVPVIAAAERLRHDLVRLEEKAAGGTLGEVGQQDLARMRGQWVEMAAALAAGTERGYGEAMAATRVSLVQVQSAMHDDEVIVAYSLWRDVGTVTVLRKTGPPTLVALDLGSNRAVAAKLLGLQESQELEAVVARLVQATQEGLWPERTGVTSPEGGTQPVVGKWPQALRLLYDLLIAPVSAEIGEARTVIVVPHGVMHYLPFEALIAGFPDDRAPAETAATVPADTRFWGLEGRVRAVAYLPTTGSLVTLRRQAGAPTAGVGIVNRPRYPQVAAGDAYQQAVAKLGPISDSVAAEVRAPGPYEAAAATPSAARQVLQAPLALAVLGCHGQANWRDPLASCLRLAPSPGCEHEAAMREGEPLDLAQTMTLPIAVPVVFLAACQTGQAMAAGGTRGSGNMGRPGDDLLSLSRGYLIAGASALVTSLWECDPAVTVDFWRAFSQAWMKGGLPVGEAVLAAKREIVRRQAAGSRTPYATPTWWAGFEVHGDPARKCAAN